MEIILIIGISLVLLFLIWDKFFDKKIIEENFENEKLKTENNFFRENNLKLKLENEKLNENKGELFSKIEELKKETVILSEKSNAFFTEKTKIESDFKNIQEKNEENYKKIIKFESKKKEKEYNFDKKIGELENSRKNLEDEKLRIREKNEEKIKKEEENKNRIWAEHEIEVVGKMREICTKPEFSFNFYENTNLPEIFDGKLKPDFLVEFLGQYIIFDAKKSSNLQNYINDQIKKTTEKIKKSFNSNKIYGTIYFIVPTSSIGEIKKTSFFEKGFTFFIITIDCFEAIISAYKKIKTYKNLDKIDPKERENIVNILCAYEQHISQRNAIDILSSIQGVKITELKNNLGEEIIDEIEVKKEKIKIQKFKDSEIKKLIKNPEEQIEEIKKLITIKKPKIKKEFLEKGIEQISFIG